MFKAVQRLSIKAGKSQHRINAFLIPIKTVLNMNVREVSSHEGETVVGRCQSKLEPALKPTRLVVHGMHDDPNGSHITVEVVSAAFEGKRIVARQRMVYQALWEEMSAGGSLHAVDSIVAKTPAEDVP